MAFAKFQENRLRIDGEIAENHAILVNLTASIVSPLTARWANIISSKCRCVVSFTFAILSII